MDAITKMQNMPNNIFFTDISGTIISHNGDVLDNGHKDNVSTPDSTLFDPMCRSVDAEMMILKLICMFGECSNYQRYRGVGMLLLT